MTNNDCDDFSVWFPPSPLFQIISKIYARSWNSLVEYSVGFLTAYEAYSGGCVIAQCPGLTLHINIPHLITFTRIFIIIFFVFFSNFYFKRENAATVTILCILVPTHTCIWTHFHRNIKKDLYEKCVVCLCVFCASLVITVNMYLWKTYLKPKYVVILISIVTNLWLIT